MKTNLEIEYKTLLTEDNFAKIKDTFDFSNPVMQTNVYFDTEDQRLFKQQIMCRIRIKNETYEFTLKIPQPEGVMEYECTLDSLSLAHPNVEGFFKEFNITVHQLHEVARSITQRSTYSDEYGEWCLDSNDFGSFQDFELEYELHAPNEKAYPHYRDTLAKLNIEYKHSSPKYIRALNSNQ